MTSTEAISSQNTYFKTDKRLRRGIKGTIRNINIRITMRIKQINPFLNTKGRVGGGGGRGTKYKEDARTTYICI